MFRNGVIRSTTFDNASRVMVVNNSSAVGVLSRFTYTRDGNGNPTGVDYTNGAGLVPAESQRLTYDNADRLTKVCQTATTCATANQTVWTYDKNGNRLTEKVGAAAQSVYTYDTTDQLTAITGPGAKSFSYNANGDQITAGSDIATFNTARQTTSATVGGVATTFAYDGNGNRHTVTTAGVATSELWDTVGGLPNLAMERSATGVVQRRYSYGRGIETLGYTDPVAATQGWYLTDAMGSVANVTNSTGVSVATYTYNPFGVARVNTTSPGYTANPLKYTGQHLDPTGNYNLRARQYNPGIGRFTQTDPMPYGAGSAYESAYVYGVNRPTVMVDPSGLRGGSGGVVNPVYEDQFSYDTNGGFGGEPTTKRKVVAPKAGPWEEVGSIGSPGSPVGVNATLEGSKYEYRLTVMAAPGWGMMSGYIAHIRDPKNSGDQIIPGGQINWSSIAGSTSRHVLPNNSYFIVVCEQGVDAADTAGVLHDLWNTWKKGTAVGWKGLISPRDGLPNELSPFRVDLARRSNPVSNRGK